jgi:hypothetical protein
MPVELPKIDAKDVMMSTACYYAHENGELAEFTKPDFVIITGESGDCYTGRWLTGVGFSGVRFPKDKTRAMTDDERQQYEQMRIFI